MTQKGINMINDTKQAYIQYKKSLSNVLKY